VTPKSGTAGGTEGGTKGGISARVPAEQGTELFRFCSALSGVASHGGTHTYMRRRNNGTYLHAHPPVPPSARAGLRASRAGLGNVCANVFRLAGEHAASQHPAARSAANIAAPSSTLRSNCRTPLRLEVGTSEL